uniref:Nucleotide modification associated domain 1 n=1 Tax=Myoviridae sp. ctgyr15 TaxID=2827291 RepID=A0A8S5R4G6_9CAUD|nr:MAG TPA: Nucleotide modification associated domain 1 [Myoviridae sp. ctgyr15]
MIKKEDIKVGLKFLLPCERIERTKVGFLYFVKIKKYSYFALDEPTDAFTVKSVKDSCVYCDIGAALSVRVDLDILQKNGFYPEYAEKLMDERKDSIIGNNLINSIIMGKQKERTDADRFNEITDKMSDTYKRKNHDYGNAFSEMYDELGINYGYGKIREKVNRIKTLKDNEAQVANEPLEDALLDCATYCILTLMEYQKRKEHGTD